MKVSAIPLRHIQMECNKDTCGGTCYACTLSVCKVCMGMEGSLTTHCVGRRLTEEEDNKIYKEGLDYFNNEWVQLEDTHPMNKSPMFK